MSEFNQFSHPYPCQPSFKKRVAYFCMEFGIDQALKIYSGGLGYLAGSHMRSVYDLKQNAIGIGILWKYGYYDQSRRKDQSMEARFIEKNYDFLQDTGIMLDIMVNDHAVKVKVWYLAPEVFGTAPIFLLSTDIEENDYLARTICHRLYDSNVNTKIAQCILLGIGGAKLLDAINYDAEVYHLNEAHALPAAFYLYSKFGRMEEVRKRMVFTTHTPVAAGNEKHDIKLLDRLGYFYGTPKEEVKLLANIDGDIFDQSLVCLRFSRLANAVSRMHGGVARQMWRGYTGICPIISITNSQNKKYWADRQLEAAREAGDLELLINRKKELKSNLFKVVADQCGKLFDPKVLTIVWARRFAAYKRADLITRDLQRFERIIKDTERPVQIIWAGKPYPTDYEAVSVFNHLIHRSKYYKNCAVLTGYELALSKLLKQGSDVWMNTPRITREASGTSGMTAAMNASVNFSTQDGWIPEFAKHGINAFVIPVIDPARPKPEQDQHDMDQMLNMLEQEIIPTYYDRPADWWEIVRNSMEQVAPPFDSDRMARDYYEKLYSGASEGSSSPEGQVLRMRI